MTIQIRHNQTQAEEFEQKHAKIAKPIRHAQGKAAASDTPQPLEIDIIQPPGISAAGATIPSFAVFASFCSKFFLAAHLSQYLLAFMLTGLLLSGCKPAPIPLPPSSASTPRIISLAPSITEIVYALNGTNQLIGRSSACDYPPAAVSNVPVIGDFGVPSLERMVSLKPDQVLYTDVADPMMDGKMKRVGLHPVHIKCDRLVDIPPAIIHVGQLIRRETEAQLMASSLVVQIQTAREQALSFTHRPRVLVLIWHDPFYAAGSKSFVSDLIALAGGQNIGDEINRDYFQASSEWVLAHDPDIIFCFFMASSTPVSQTIMRQPGWSHIKAVRDGRVYDGFDNNIALRPGPRVMQGLEVIKKQIHAKK